MKRLERLLLLALVLGAGLWAFLFSLANSEPVALDLVFVRLEPAALSVWLIAAFVAGGLCGCSRQRGNLAYAARPVAFAARTCGADGRTRHLRTELRQRVERGVSTHHRRLPGRRGRRRQARFRGPTCIRHPAPLIAPAPPGRASSLRWTTLPPGRRWPWPGGSIRAAAGSRSARSCSRPQARSWSAAWSRAASMCSWISSPRHPQHGRRRGARGRGARGVDGERPRRRGPAHDAGRTRHTGDAPVPRPLLVAVTVLTSMEADELAETG